MDWMNHVKVMRYSSIAALFATATSTSGCFTTDPNGFEFSATLGGHRVSSYSQRSETKELPCAGLKAWVMGCPASAPLDDGQPEGRR